MKEKETKKTVLSEPNSMFRKIRHLIQSRQGLSTARYRREIYPRSNDRPIDRWHPRRNIAAIRSEPSIVLLTVTREIVHANSNAYFGLSDFFLSSPSNFGDTVYVNYRCISIFDENRSWFLYILTILFLVSTKERSIRDLWSRPFVL